MSRIALGILVGVLIFIASGFLAAYWIAKMQQDAEQRKPKKAYCPHTMERFLAMKGHFLEANTGT